MRQIESLSQLKTEADIRNTMRALSTETLNDLYDNSFTRITESGRNTREYAKQIFSVLLCAQEALSPEALIQATTSADSQQGEAMTLAKIFDICLNLVVLDSELKVLRFTHASFQDYLEKKAEFSQHNVHKEAAKYCLDLCLKGLPPSMEINSSPKDSFYHYSAVHWAEHCRIAIVDGHNVPIISKMQEFVFHENDVSLGFVDWIQEVGKFAKELPRDHRLLKELNSLTSLDCSPLLTACVFGLIPIVNHLQRTPNYDWNQTNDVGISGLYLAAATGQSAVVQSLLKRGVNINISGGKFKHPLHAACFGGHTLVVELLLDHGANPKIGIKSALEYAILAGHQDIALLLLASKFDIADQAEYDLVLQRAAGAGFADAVHFLQKKYGFLYGDHGSSRCRAVELAIFNGRTGVVERYMRRLSDLAKNMPAGAIATAALGGQDDMIRLLVDHGMDLNEEGLLGIPLRAACIMGHESTVRLLLRLGASLHASGSFGHPLQAAAMRGHATITRTLISHGADVNDEGGLYGTALQAAAHRGHPKVVKILLEAGADVYRGGLSRDAFHAASEGGHEGVVRLLLESGFVFQEPLSEIMYNRGVPERDVLRDASPSRNREMKSAEDEQPRPRNWRERASTADFAHVVESMRGNVGSGLEVIQPYSGPHGYLDRNEDYALRAAAAKGHAPVVQLLLSQLGTATFQESEIIAAFEEACEKGHEKVVNLLISDRMEEKDFGIGLEAAALNCHLKVVDVLIDYEDRLGLARIKTANISKVNLERTKDYRLEDRLIDPKDMYECDYTAYVVLISGSKEGCLPIFRRGQELVAHRCTAVAARHMYENALTIAATNCKTNIIEALLESNIIYSSEKLANGLVAVCLGGSEELLERFLAHDTEKMLGVDDFSAGLKSATRNCNRQIVIYWLEKHHSHQDLSIDPETVIEVSEDGYIDVLPPLIEKIRHMASFTTTLSRCLHIASRNGHAEVIEYLIIQGAHVNGTVEGESALQAALDGFKRLDERESCPTLYSHRADVHSQTRSIETLLAKGADPNMIAKDERYPLNIAAACCSTEIVQALISSGAHIEAATEKHGTALCAAASREMGSLPIIEALLKANAAVSPDVLGTAVDLFEANSLSGTRSWSRHNTVIDVLDTGPGAAVKILLDHLPKTNVTGLRYGLLAQMACAAGARECIALLLKRGMDVNGTGHHYGTALQAASRFGNIEIVEYLLKYDADVNILQGEHGTALRAAVLGGHEDVARSLIAHGADFNLRYEKDKPILYLALESRSCVILKALLDIGSDMDTEVANRRYIMIEACLIGNTSFVDLLLAESADPNIPGINLNSSYSRSDKQITPLHAACSEGHLAVVRLLLDHGADIEKTYGSSATPLIAAISHDHLPVVKLLLDAGANANHTVCTPPLLRDKFDGDDESAVYTTPLSEAVEHSRLEIIQELLSAGVIIGGPSAGRKELAEACNNRQYMVVELLLETLSGAQDEAEICNEALSAAVESGDDRIVSLLLDDGVSPTPRMLYPACSAGVLGPVRIIVEMGADVNQKDFEDTSPIHVAAYHSRPNIVQFLIDAGANVMLSSQKYGTPLIAALEGCLAPLLRYYTQTESCRSLAERLPFHEPSPAGGQIAQCEQIVRSMFNAGAEMDTTLRLFGNALHLASYMGSEMIVREMLERMEDVNTFGGYFGSPLIAAVKGNHPNIVATLLRRAIDINHYAPEHGSTLHCACALSHEKTVQSLLDHGADINAYDDGHGSPLAAAAFQVSISIRYSTEPHKKYHTIIEMLLRHEPKVQIKECDLQAAASCACDSDSDDLVRRFLRHDQSAEATESVTTTFIKNNRLYGGRLETLQRLLKHDRGLGVTPAMLKATEAADVMEALLKHKPICEVTGDVLESAASRDFGSLELVKLLLAHSPSIPITDATIIAALEHGRYNSMLGVLLDHHKGVKITHEMLEAVKSRYDMELLLQRRTEEQTISSKILEKAAKRYGEGASLVSLLLKYDKSLKITPTVVHAAMVSSTRRYVFLNAILEHDPTLTITEEDVIGLIKTYKLELRLVEYWSYENRSNGDQEDILGLLTQHGKTVEFTVEITKALNECFSSHSDKTIKERFYELERR